MRKIINIIIFIFMLLSSTLPTYAINPYYIEELNVEWTLKENGLLYVHETYQVHFNDTNLDGISLELPIHKNFYFSGDERKSVDAAITNVKVLNPSGFDMKETMDGYKIEFKDYEKGVNEKEVYEISYLVKLDPISFNGNEVVVYDIGDNRVEGKVQQLNFNVELPKSINEDQVNVFAIYKDDLEYHIENNKIEGTIKNISISNNVEIVIRADEGYLHTINYETINYISMGICYILVFIVVYILRRNGKENEIHEIVDVSIVSKFNPLEVGFLKKGYSDQRDVVALFLQWAQKGYIDIQYIKEQRTIIFHKKKEIITNINYERQLFDKMFSSGKSMRMKMLRTMYGDVIKKAQKEMTNTFRGSDKKVYLSSTEKMLLYLMCSMPLIILIGAQMYARTMSLLYLLLIIVVYGCLLGGLCAFMMYLTKKKMNHVIFIISECVIASAILWYSYKLYGKYIPLSLLAITVILSMILIFTVCYMKLRSDYGSKVLSEVNGLHKYLVNEKLEEVKSQKFKEELLPYAYALKLENAVLPYLDDVSWFVIEEFVEMVELMDDHFLSITVERRYIR